MTPQIPHREKIMKNPVLVSESYISQWQLLIEICTGCIKKALRKT
jgi:hypothetical protein